MNAISFMKSAGYSIQVLSNVLGSSGCRSQEMMYLAPAARAHEMGSSAAGSRPITAPGGTRTKSTVTGDQKS